MDPDASTSILLNACSADTLAVASASSNLPSPSRSKMEDIVPFTLKKKEPPEASLSVKWFRRSRNDIFPSNVERVSAEYCPSGRAGQRGTQADLVGAESHMNNKTRVSYVPYLNFCWKNVQYLNFLLYG